MPEKLVRSKVPYLRQSQGEKPVPVRIASPEELRTLLIERFFETDYVFKGRLMECREKVSPQGWPEGVTAGHALVVAAAEMLEVVYALIGLEGQAPHDLVDRAKHLAAFYGTYAAGVVADLPEASAQAFLDYEKLGKFPK